MLKVVLADDENKVILLMRKLIDWEALGYEVVGTANDGLHALELVQTQQPHLLITDIRMPGCDGIELIRRAKEMQPRLHFIVISGYRQFEYAQSALKYGVEDYLLKPLKQEELSSILLRIKDKLGEEAALEFQLQKNSERQQERFM
ncbi:MAG: response regulator, partial [Agathobaculum sp.]